MRFLGSVLALAGVLYVGSQARAQSISSAAQPAGNLSQDQARRAAEAEAADRAARANAPEVHLGASGASSVPAGGLGAFPVEAKCFVARQIVVDTVLPGKLRWVPAQLKRFEGRCIGAGGINYILKSLEGDFLSRGLVTTRAGLPAQDLAKGVLHIAVVPGVLAGVKGGTAKERRMWAAASPMKAGDLINLRAMEQALEQIRSLRGGDAKADLAPGSVPGESIIQLKVQPPQTFTASVSVNNMGGATLGDWSGSGQFTLANLLGHNESLTVNVNNRLFDPSLPANSSGSGISLNVPAGYWTFGANISRSYYIQEVVGQVATFNTSNTYDTIAATITRVIARDSTSKTDVLVKVQRRWGRSYINGVEISLQHQDISDVSVALNDRRTFPSGAKLESSLSFRQGVGLLGAQTDQAGLPESLPSARYSIASLDLALTRPLTRKLTYRGAYRLQYSPRALFGPDVISAGGPYTVRGYDGDHADVGHSGYYMRSELIYEVSKALQPYALCDAGHIYTTNRYLIGAGGGLRASYKWLNLDAFAAMPLNDRNTLGQHRVQFGLSLGASI